MKLKHLFFGLLLSAFSNYIGAQSYSVSSGSDYQIVVGINGMSTSFCSCTSSTSLDLYDNYGHTLFNAGCGSGAVSTQAYNPGSYVNYTANISYGGYKCSSPAVCGACVESHSCVPANGYLNFYGSTASIKAPVNFNISETGLGSFQVARVTWAKGSNMPDSLLSYRIYRDGGIIGTIPGGNYSYIDSNILPTGTHTYAVTSYSTGLTNNGSYESNQGSAQGTVYLTNDVLTASQGTYYGRTVLTWPNMAVFAPNGVEVLNNGVQLAVVDKNSTTYNDYSGVPGVKYNYSVGPINANNVTLFTFSDSGYSRPNGQLKGNVYTIYNAAVSGVNMYAYATVDGNFILDSTLTDASGYYEFDDLFYDTSAIYTLVPHKGSHKFNPDTLTRTLGLNTNVASGVDFTDTSSYTIAGTVTFTPSAHCPTGGCHAVGVTIYSNGVPTSGVSDVNGHYSFAIQTAGTYVIKPIANGHIFSPDSVVINVSSDSFGVNFTDLTTDTLYITLQGGCHNQVAYDATVNIGSDNNGDFSYTNDDLRNSITSTVSQMLILPAQPYTVSFGHAYSGPASPNPNIDAAFGVSTITVDLTTKDTATTSHVDTIIHTVPAVYDTLLNGQIITIAAHIDTTVDTLTSTVEVQHRADFIYHGQIIASVPNYPLYTGCSNPPNNGYILEQGENTAIQLMISEFYSYDSTSCPVDSGQINIYDDVSDISQVQTVSFYNGSYTYVIQPGSPNIASPYTKLLEFFITVGNSNTTWPSTPQEIIVLGQKPHTQTFVTKTPELPFFILHAPPGSNSFSFLGQDSSVNYSYSNSYQVGGSAGPYVDAKIGAGVPIPFTGIVVGAGVEITAEAQVGGSQEHSSNVNTTFTAHQQISTSNANANNATNSMYVGHEGDVYVGGSFNMIYALTDVIELNTSCTIVRDTQLAWGANGLATNYIYTEDHIMNTLIPQLQELKALSSVDTAALIQTYIDVWNQVVQKNHRNSDTTSTFVQNVSFSSGILYDNTTTSASDSTQSISYNTFLNVDAGIGVVFGALDEFDNTSLGVKVNFNWNMNKDASTNVTKEKTIGYHLEDDFIGNYYSVNVNTDNAYGVPAFTVVAGATSCPHWPGTQARDSVQLTMDNYAVYNVPITQTANFTTNITNLSESQETRTYNVEAVPESNPNGAIISIGGQQINNSPASFTVAAGTSLPVILTVAPGPTAADYTGLQVSASSPCDGGEGNTITFEAHFQSSCSPIGVYTPSDNWLVNAGNHDSLLVIFSGYNANDSNLINIGLEYSSPGGTWIPATNPPIAKARLNSTYYNFYFDVTALPDGPYQLRAFANCGAVPGGITYSPILSGTIDRSSLSLFGTPSPADGVLNINDNISVGFNGAVNCNQAAIYTPIYSTLVRADNGQVIPDSVTCSGNSLIIYTNPPSLIDSLEGVTLTATINNVYDMYGNSLQQPIVWSFLVSRSKVFWSPANLNITAVTGATANTSATMYNTGPQDTFTLIHIPSWLSTPQAANYVIASGTPASPSQLSIQFTALNSLNPGTYSDTIVAYTNGQRIYLFVTLDVVSPSPTWSVNANNFQYNMNITTNYSKTQLNTPLSTDTRDIIAAFVGNQCRGVGNIAYNGVTNTYTAFITAYSNSVVGDTFTFRMWNAKQGIEYQAVERLPFITDGSIGQPEAPYILHPAGEFQTVTFAPGWNWFSLDVAALDMTPGNVLATLTGNNGAVVKTQSSYDQYTTAGQNGAASTGWKGTLTAFNTNTSYMINLDHADTLHFLGQPIITTSNMSIASGWNWVGFPRQSITTAPLYLNNTNPSNGDIFKSETQFTEYNAGNWAGNLLYLYPGEGYKLKSANAYNFVVPAGRSLPSWNVDENLFEQNMTVTADLQFDGISTTQSNYLVGAFADSICIGTAQPEFIASENLYRVFITIHGDTGNANRPLTFKVYDTNNDIEYVPTYMPISVVPDTTVARVEAPYVINIETTTGINAINYTDGFSLLQNVPNPFSKTTSIQYTIPSEQSVTLTLYDEAGRLIRELVNGTQTAGSHSVSFEQDNLQAGVYFYQMKAGDFTKTRKMLILLQ